MDDEDNNDPKDPKDPEDQKKEEENDSSIFLSFIFLDNNKKKSKESVLRARELLNHYCNTEDEDGIIESYILPLVAQYYTSLRGYITFIDSLIRDDNLFVDDASGAKRVRIKEVEIQSMRMFMTSINICELEMMDLGISVKIH